MSIFSFRIPAPTQPAPPTAPSTAASSATPSAAGALLDQLIDPVTLDYVRTDHGEWAETADSRAAVLIMIETELGASPFFPRDGTRIKAMLRAGDPVTPEMVQAETLRAGRILQLAGIMSDLTADVRDVRGRQLVDETGRQVVRMHWRDLVGGSPVDLVLQPSASRVAAVIPEGGGGGGDGGT